MARAGALHCLQAAFLLSLGFNLRLLAFMCGGFLLHERR